MVSRQTIYNVLKAARVNILKPQNSINSRFKQARYGIKRLAKVEKAIQDKLKKQAKRYNIVTTYKKYTIHPMNDFA